MLDLDSKGGKIGALGLERLRKGKTALAFACLLVFLLVGCVLGPVHGIAGTYTVFPGEFQPANDVPYELEAEDCMYSILGIYAGGNASAGSIARQNRIGRIAIVDHSTLSIWSGVYVRYCTIVVGERRKDADSARRPDKSSSTNPAKSKGEKNPP